MNKIYRTVYNETTGTWVAVCETAKTHTKSSGSVVDNATESVSGSLKAYSLTAVTAAAALLSPLMANQAQAADVLCKNNSTGVVSAKAACETGESLVESLAVGSNAQVNSNHSFAFGNNAIVNTGSANSVALGSDSKVGPNANNSFAAVGGSAITNNTIAIGVRSIADGNGAIAFGSGINEGNNSGSYAKSEGSIAIGKRAEAVRAEVTYSGQSGNYFLPQDEKTETITLADGTQINHEYTYNRRLVNDGTANQMIAIGDNASAYGNQSIALGGNSVATGYAAISIGGDDIGHVENNHNAQGIQYLTDTLATELTNGGFTTPESINNLKNKDYFVNLTTAKGAVSTAFGVKAVAEGDFSNAYGTAARSVGLNSNAIGTTSYAGGQESIAFGTAAYTNMQAEKATAIGYMSQIGENGDNSVAFGAKNKVTETNSAAIGQNNTVETANTFVLGNNVGKAEDKTIANSVYLGAGSTTATTKGGAGLNQVQNATVGGITYGDFAGQKAQGIVSVGTDSSARRIQNVAAGKIDKDSTDAINGSQLHAVLPQYKTDPTTKNVTSVTVGNQTYNFAQGGAADGNDITELTVNDYQAAGNTTGNLKLTDQGSGDSHNYNVALNNTVELGDNTADGSLTVGNQKGDSKTEINPNSINFTNQNGGSITNVASHLKDQAATDTAMNDANNPSNFTNEKNEAATVGDVLNAGWNLQVADDNGNLQAADFVQHGDTVKFGDSDTVNAKYDGGVIKFSVNTTTPDPVITDPAKPNVGKVVIKSGDENKIVTAGDLATAINSSGWVASDSTKNAFVATGDKVTIVGAGGTTVELNDQNKTFTVKSVEISKYDGTPNTQNADATVTEITDADGNKYKIGGGSSGDENWNLTVDGDNTNATSPNAQRNLKDSNTVNVTQDGNNITFDVITTPLSVVDSGDKAGSVNAVKNEDKNKLVTAGDVANVVNNTYWTASDGSNTTPVKASDTVTFKGADNGNVSVTNNGGTFEFAVKTADKDPTVTGITSTVGGNDGDILTAKQITQTINQVAQNWKWNIQGQDDGVNQNGGKAAEVKYDNTVNINAGKGLSLNQNGQTLTLNSDYVFKNGDTDVTDTGGDVTKIETTDGAGKTVTYNITGGGSGENNWNLTVGGDDTTVTKPSDKRNLTNTDGNIAIALDPTNNEDISFDLADSITVGDTVSGSPVVIDGTANGGTITFMDNKGNVSNQGVIDGVANHFDNVGNSTTMPTNNAPAHFATQTNQAATLGDVLNAGWGLKANGSAVDFVAHGDTVDFVSTDKSITITPSVTDGKDSVLNLSANVTFYADDAGNTEANSSDKAKSVRVGNKLYQLGGDTYTVTGPNTPVTVVGQGSVKVVDDGTGAEYTVSIPVVANSGGNAATAASVANNSTGSVAVGEGAIIANNVENSIAIGKEATVERDGNNNIVIGSGSTISENGQNVTVIGNNITANSSSKNAVVIGTGSTVGEVNANSVKAGGLSENAAGDEFAFRERDTEYSNKDKFAVFSVGSGSLKRQIQNVAAGKVNQGSTDAVNGDQLYSVAVAVANTGNSLAGGATVDPQTGAITGGTGVLGESFTVNTDDAYGKIGTIIGKNIAGTGEDTIEDAIKATKTIVEKESGSPITVSETKNGDKSTTYTVGIETTTPETVITDPADSNVGKVVITSGDENKIVTAGDLATAINSSGWVASDSTNNAFVATGDTVTIQGKNGVKVGLDAKTQTFTVESDYVFKDKDGNDVTNAGGDVTAIETTDDAGNTVTYNIGGGDGNDVTSLTAQGENANSTTGNLKLTDSGTGDSHQYDIALNNTVELGDSTTDGSLTVGNQAGDSKTEINPNNINFTNADGGSITNVASHLQDPASKDDKGQVINPANTPDNFNSVKNEAATVGDVLNAGWNLKVGDTDADFVQHGDTVAFGNGKGTTAQYDATNGVVSFDIDYVFKDGNGDDITNKGGDVATITTKDDKGNDVTYNFGDGNDNTVTAVTVNGGQDAATNKADGGNLTLTETKDADGNPTYDIALNNNVKLGDDKGNSGSLNVNNGTGGSTNIEGNKITFGDTTTPNSGSIDGLAQHFTKTGDTTAPSVATGTTDDQAATVGDVKNVGWNLKVGDTVQDFVNHGDTVAFADGTGTKAKYDDTTGAVSFDIAKAGDSKVDTTVTNADAGKVTGGKGDEYWDSNQVQNAINNAGWKVGVGAKANAKDELINAGDRVGLVAGQGVKVTQDGSNFTFATDYVFKDGQGDDITNKGGDVATITTKDDKGNDVTYNFGDGNDNTVTAVTVNGGQDATANQADGGNLKLTESKDANGNPTYDIALNDEVDLTDKGSLKVGGDDIANGSPVTNITAGNIDFGDQQGSITNVASHLKDPASKDDKGQVINPDNAPANFNSVKNEAATVGDVLNAGWNLKVGDQDADFVQHGDTVAFGNSDTVSASYDSGVIKFNANTTPLTVNNTTGVVNAPANNNALVTAGDVQTAINNAGWFVSSQGRAGAAAPVLVNAGNEVKFIAGDGMDIVQNGKELTFNAKIVDTNGNQLKLDQDGNYVVGIVDPSGNPVTVNSDGEFVVGGGSSSGGGRPFVITADDGTGNQSTTTIDGVAKTEGSGVTFVGDENVKVIKQPTQGGDGTDVVVGLQNKVNVGGTSDGTANGTPNAGSVTIDGSNQNGGSITFNNTNPDNSVTVNGDSGSLNLGQGANNNPVNITNVNKGADGSNDAVNVAQIEDVVGAANKDANGVVKTTGTNGEEYTLKTYNVKDQGEYLTNNVVEAVSKMNEQGIKFFHTNEDENFVPVAQDHNSVDSSASGGLSTAIGVKAKANGKQAIVVGNESEANGVQSIAVGTQVVVNGDHSGGIGDPTIIDGSNSYSVGNMNSVSTNNTFVLGNEVTNTADNSVFLGDKSAANAKGAGATGTVNNATVGGISYSGFAGETSVGMVAVGNDTQVRRVSGVAAGEISATSTDAINGSQLHAVLPQYTVGSNGKVDNVTVGDKTYDFANYDFVGANGVDVNVDGASNTVTISGTPGYASGVKAGENVTFNYEDNKDDAGNQLYVTNAGGATTNAADPDVKVDAAGNPVKQQTTVINANLKPVHNRIDQVQNQVQQVENNAYAGVAQAMATAGLPQAYLPGKSMVAIAGGHYKGEQGYAVGVSSISDSGNWVFKATASGNTRGNVGGTIGAGYQW